MREIFSIGSAPVHQSVTKDFKSLELEKKFEITKFN